MKRISPRVADAAIMLGATRLSSPRDHRGLAPGRVAAPIRSWSQMPVPSPDGSRPAFSSPARRASHKRSPASPRRRAGAPRPGPGASAGSCPTAAGRAARSPARAARRSVARPVRAPPGWSAARTAAAAGRASRRAIQPLAAPRQHPPAVEHAVLAPLAVALDPDVHGLAVDADYLGRDVYVRLEELGYRHKTVCHARGENAPTTATGSARSTSTPPRALVAAALLAPAAPGRLAGEAAGLPRLLPARPQRLLPREGPARRPRRHPHRTGQCSPPQTR